MKPHGTSTAEVMNFWSMEFFDRLKKPLMLCTSYLRRAHLERTVRWFLFSHYDFYFCSYLAPHHLYFTWKRTAVTVYVKQDPIWQSCLTILSVSVHKLHVRKINHLPVILSYLGVIKEQCSLIPALGQKIWRSFLTLMVSSLSVASGAKLRSIKKNTAPKSRHDIFVLWILYLNLIS